MRVSHSVKLGLWVIIVGNIVMALGSIWAFGRMTPAIEQIIDRNARSLYSGEQMLRVLATIAIDTVLNESAAYEFEKALFQAEKNITEEEEPVAIAAIYTYYKGACHANRDSLQKTVSAVVKLCEINRAAMIVADKQARQFGFAGAWAVVFMAVAMFLSGMIYLGALKKNVLIPFEEIQSVFTARKKGDTIRRCGGRDLSRDTAQLYGMINDHFDRLG